MNILFLSSWYPYPPDNGSKLRVYNLLRGLAEFHDVTLLSFTDQLRPETPRELKVLCRDVYAVRRQTYNSSSKRAITGFFSLTPRSMSDTYQQEMAALIRRVLETKDIDLVIASQWWTAAYHSTFTDVPAIYEEMETGLLVSKVARASNRLYRFRHGLPLLKLRAYLRQTLPRFQKCTVVSENEKKLLQQMVPDYPHIHVVPNGIQTADYKNILRPPIDPNRLIFTGSLSYSANLDGIRWFLTDVFPIIQEQAPEVKLLITGRSGKAPLPEMGNIIRTGYVEDVRPFIASASISIAPILEGGGTRLKILEAMAVGTAVVATRKGAEGLDVQDNEHVLLADTPDQFANAVLRLLQDSKLRLKLAENSCRLIREQYDWAVIMPEFLNLVEEAVHA